ncbi:rRNA 2'-O-methyltransferase fibrillarin-like, partial [Penaeus indicus]|uniref:rRNA 2'-O-methyltransferase fibrillarin-like n=1 Tax=Penaeus indicus TaxID=29960 RepID=UPI00300C814E
MGGRGGARYSSKSIVIQTNANGTRQYFEHDDRGGNRGGAGGGRGNYRSGYRNNPKGRMSGRGGRNREGWDGDRGGGRMPEGHWRGNPRRGGSNRPYRPQGPHYPDDDVDMSEGKERN